MQSSSATCPRWAFGHRMPIWWGTLGFMVIEGTGFVMAGGRVFLFWPARTRTGRKNNLAASACPLGLAAGGFPAG